MGNVNFNTDVTKNVNINKNVLYDILKDVETNVDLDGSLASAEASADAVGGGGENGEREELTFLIDGFTEFEGVTVDSDLQNTPANTNPALGMNPNTGTAPSPVDFPIPNGETFEVTTIPDGRRFANVFVTEGVDALFEASNVTGRGRFASGDQTASNDFVRWTSDSGPFSIVVPGFDQNDPADIGDINNRLEFSGAAFNPGNDATGGDATVRVELTLQDADGDIVTTAAAFVEGFNNLNIEVPLATFVVPGAAPAPGDFIPGTGNNVRQVGFNGDVDGGVGDGTLDLTQIDVIRLNLLDDPAAFSSEFALQSFERLSVSGTDASLDDIFVFTETGEDGNFHLAETETFAQVTEDGAFSFSDALAARSGAIIEDILL